MAQLSLRTLTLIASLGAIAPPLAAQTAAARTPEQLDAAYEAHKGDFDYLLGDWEYSAVSKQWGKHDGLWSAVRLVDGQILDEFRVTDGKGETLHMTTTIRAYNALIDRWEVIGMNGSRGMPDVGTAWRVGEEVHLEQKFGVMSPNPSILRVRYYNIQADRFSWKADRSTDGGKTWVKDHLTIEARRIGPPRSQGPLAVARAR